MHRSYAILVLLVAVVGTWGWAVQQPPEQIHVGPYNLNGHKNEYVFRWATAVTPRVMNGTDPLSHYNAQVNIWEYHDEYEEHGEIFTGRSWLYQEPGSEPGSFDQLFHEVVVDLKKWSKGGHRHFRYQVGDNTVGWSSTMMLEVLPKRLHSDEPLKLIMWGDMGYENPVSLSLIEKRAREEALHGAVQLGDFAYDFHTDNGTVGDGFMRAIQPVASRMPYLTTMGNHEFWYDFSHYLNRFTLPHKASKSTSPMYWSIDIPHVHLVSFSTELYFYSNETSVREQYEWLDSDLAAVDRTKTPWVIVLGHRPMHCSAREYFCGENAKTLSEGIWVMTGEGSNHIRKWGFEELLIKHSVDVYFNGHIHSYERNWPARWGTPDRDDGIMLSHYHKPKSPVHVTVGNGGNRELVEPFLKPTAPTTAKQYEGYGYGVLEVTATHVSWRQYSAPDNQEVDHLTITKDKHLRTVEQPSDRHVHRQHDHGL
eukprot:Clim_evm19s237 gene=Clim_evmTU19s237